MFESMVSKMILMEKSFKPHLKKIVSINKVFIMENDLSKKFQTIYNKIDEYLRNQLKVDKNVSHSYLIKK